MLITHCKLSLEKPCELVVNNQGSFILVSNGTQVQIIRSLIEFGNQNNHKIIL